MFTPVANGYAGVLFFLGTSGQIGLSGAGEDQLIFRRRHEAAAVRWSNRKPLGMFAVEGREHVTGKGPVVDCSGITLGTDIIDHRFTTGPRRVACQNIGGRCGKMRAEKRDKTSRIVRLAIGLDLVERQSTLDVAVEIPTTLGKQERPTQQIALHREIGGIFPDILPLGQEGRGVTMHKYFTAGGHFAPMIFGRRGQACRVFAEPDQVDFLVEHDVFFQNVS